MKTLAESLREEAQQLHRRFLHHTRQYPKLEEFMSKPYPKISPNAMRQDAREKQASWHSPTPNLDKMRSHANANQEDKGNQSNGQLNSLDREHGSVKGGC